MVVTLKDVRQEVQNSKYSIRGPIAAKANELSDSGIAVYRGNIGNPRELGMPRLTHISQIMSIVENPKLLAKKSVLQNQLDYPLGTIRIAERIVDELKGKQLGAYSESAAYQFVRQAVATYIVNRDGIPADKDSIILTEGASAGIQMVLEALIKDHKTGVLVPIPEYPLYSASVACLEGKAIGYHTDKEEGFGITESDLEAAIKKASQEKIKPKLMIVNNPSNPTGHVLSGKDIEMILKFAKKHDLAILADEVYQDNLYNGNRFISFARVMHEKGIKEVSLFSFHSISKGYIGECGSRGGYVEMRNVPEDVYAEILKLQSMVLCSNINGQVITYLMASPPTEHSGHKTFLEERQLILATLSSNVQRLHAALNKIPNISCPEPQGGYYLFPDIGELPKGGPNEDKPDENYCMELLLETGIATASGSGFREANTIINGSRRNKPNNFRITIPYMESDISMIVERLAAFDRKFRKQGRKLVGTH